MRSRRHLNARSAGPTMCLFERTRSTSPFDGVTLRGMPWSPDAPLARLQTSLRSATDLMVPWSLFHDEIAVVPELMTSSEPGTHPTLVRVLEAAVAQAIGRTAKLTNPAFLQLPAHRFWHGMAAVEHRTVIAFLFDESGQGLVGLIDDPEGQNVTLIRVSTVALSSPAFHQNTRGST